MQRDAVRGRGHGVLADARSAGCVRAGRRPRSRPPPSMSVLFDAARSADPPNSSGSTGASAPITAPDCTRVAFAPDSCGSASRQPDGSSRRTTRRSKSAAASGCAVAKAANRASQAAVSSAPRATDVEVGAHVVRDGERFRMRPAERRLRRSDLVVTQRCTVRRRMCRPSSASRTRWWCAPRRATVAGRTPRPRSRHAALRGRCHQRPAGCASRRRRSVR